MQDFEDLNQDEIDAVGGGVEPETVRNVATGAAIGAAIGSLGGPAGAVGGAIIGGVGGYLYSLFD